MKHAHLIINAAKGSDTVDLLLYGIIAQWSDANGQQFANLLPQLEKKYKNLRIFVNTDGGSVIEGIAIFNALKRSSLNISFYVDGVAASMGGVLLQLPNAKRYMAKHTRLMLHNVSGMVAGTAQKLRDYADMIDSFEVDLVEIVAERTGKDAETVRSTWFNQKDNWLTPEQALEAGLIDGIVDGKVKAGPDNVTNVQEVVNFYDTQIVNFNSKSTDMDLITIINAVGMPANSTEDAVLAKLGEMAGTIVSQKARIQELEQAQEDAEKTAVKNLLDQAVVDKKITEGQRAEYEKLANADFKTTQSIINAMPKPKKLSNVPEDAPIPESRKDWTFQNWQKKDGKGLQNLREKHPEEFKKLRESMGQ